VLFTFSVKKHATHGVIATAGIWTLDAIPTCWLVYPSLKCNASAHRE
jgi:hypothetical protein